MTKGDGSPAVERSSNVSHSWSQVRSTNHIVVNHQHCIYTSDPVCLKGTRSPPGQPIAGPPPLPTRPQPPGRAVDLRRPYRRR
jgi:hypothetical protein